MSQPIGLRGSRDAISAPQTAYPITMTAKKVSSESMPPATCSTTADTAKPR